MTKRKSAAPAIQLNMTVAADINPIGLGMDDSLLESLLAQLGDDGELAALDASEEIEEVETLEAADGFEIAMADVAAAADDTSFLDDLAADADRIAAKHAMYAEQPEPTVGGDAPEEVTEETGKKAKKVKAAKAPKAPKEPKAPRELRATKVTHKPGALLLAKLGANATDYLALDINDAYLPVDDLTAKIDNFVTRLNSDAVADKVGEKIIMFMTWIKTGGKLNEVLARSITLLHATGELTSGDKGSLQLNLLSKPYSLGTARSQANQMFMALPELGIVIKEKGRMIANPNSTLLPMAYSALGLA